MNIEHLEGTAKQVLGKAQQKLGEVLGNKRQLALGLKNQAEGRAQHMLADVKAVLKALSKKI